MTDGVARIVSGHGTAEQVARVIPRMGARSMADRRTGAMFVTERAGGSDVGANETTARRGTDGKWRLSGRKWFCSSLSRLVDSRTIAGYWDCFSGLARCGEPS